MNPSNLYSQKPDFAFPQTVSKNAETDLKAAIKKDDAHAALNALIRLYVSEYLIDQESAPKSIAKIEGTTSKFKDSSLAGIFYALQATAYNNYYSSNRWRFDNRELPLEPRPADISEWSGAMFRDKIAALCHQSVSNPKGLSLCKTADYTDIVKADALTLMFYPTLLDFACSQAISLNPDDDNATYYELGQQYSPQTLLWQSMKVQGSDLSTSDKLEQLKAYYLGNCDNEHSAIDLIYYGDMWQDKSPVKVIDEDDNDVSECEDDDAIMARGRWLLQAINSYLQNFPNSLLAKQLQALSANIKQQFATVTTPNYVAPNQEFEINLTWQNAKKVNIKIYKVPSNCVGNDKAIKNAIKAANPYKIIPVEFDGELPFKQAQKINITLDEIGYYALFPEIPGTKGNNSYIDLLLCIDRMPAAVSNATKNYGFVVNPVTGAPIAAQQLVIYYDNAKFNAPLTDQDGISNISATMAKTKYGHGSIGLKYGNELYKFDRLGAYLSKPDKQSNTNISAQVLTDRSIYRPGDKIQFLAIVSSLTTQGGKQPQKELVAQRQAYAILLDANHQEVDTIVGTTDYWGRFTGEFIVPTDGLTGQFTLIVSQSDNHWDRWGARSVMVSEYKMPDFELIDINVAKDTPARGQVTVSGKARMYSGMPLANAQISMILSSSSLWRWFSPDEKIWSTEVTTDADGTFSIEVPASVLQDNKEYNWFIAQIDAVSPTGTTADASKVFALGKQYAISVESPTGNVDGQQPLLPQVKVFGADGNPATIALKWEIKQDRNVVMSGSMDQNDIDISSLTPGTYDFIVSPVDDALADAAVQGFTVYNRSTDIVPGNDAIWVENDNLAVGADNKIAIDYGVKEGCYLYYAVGVADSICELKLLHVQKGYHSLSLQVPGDLVSGKVFLFTTLDFKTQSRSISITRREDTGLKIIAESFRDKLSPSSTESWRFKIVDAKGKPVQAAFAMDMYNKALEALAPQYFNIFFPTGRIYTSMSLSTLFNGSNYNYYSVTVNTPRYNSLVAPEFYFYDQYLSGYMYSRSKKYGASMKMANDLEGNLMMDSMDGMSVGSAPMMMSEAVMEDAEEEVATTSGSDNGMTKSTGDEEFDYRDSSLPLALWVPMLTTDSDGSIAYTFQVPNAVTTWRLQCIAWSRGMEAGSMLRDLVASKPVMAQANAPRFLRAGDKAIISALVMNNSDHADTVTSVIEIFDPLTGKVLNEATVTSEIGAMESATVNIEAFADGQLSTIGYRIRSTMGDFTDGEQTIVPILSSVAQLIETEPFYLNPGDTNYSTSLPSADDARITLSFSENPVWSIVSALPGLRTQIDDYANSAAAALFSAALAQGLLADNPNIAKALKEWSENPADSTLVSMLQQNEDLKIALLNATPWVESAMSDTDRMVRLANIFDKKETQGAIDKAIGILDDLQRSDGGWAWGKWCDKSSEWVTSNVLEMLGDLKHANWLPKNSKLDKMIEKALKYYDHEVSTLHPGQKELYPNMLYCILRPQFPDVPISSEAQKVVKITLDDIEKHWKKYSDPAYKSSAAMALYRNGRQEKARLLMSSVSEFGVRTPAQGIRFPNVNALSSYSIILLAFATIDPNSQYVDGLRQQLIVRKQGTDWGSAVVTSQVVAGILSCGTHWTVPAQGATVMAGDHLIEPATAIEKYTGSFKANLSQYAGEQLHIQTPGTGPAYGAVFVQFKQAMETVESHACDDLSIEKQMTVRRGTQWEMLPDTLQVGDRIKIQLTIHCKRNLNYVTIVDERAACFEPVDQIPGWMWSEGAGFYRENRDASTNLFVISLRPGTYLLTYEMNVGNAGVFTSGVATIQSQYAPEISAHSQGTRITSIQK